MRKKNVLGCFLGQDLSKVRHASNIFYHACLLINPPASKGKFTKEEDQLILSEVLKNGASAETWKKLAHELDRRNGYTSIKTRYINLTKHKFLQNGKFEFSEDEIILQGLFSCEKETNIQGIESINFKSFGEIAEILNRTESSIKLRWNRSLKPILLSHHYGTLHRPWKKELFEHLIEKRIIGRQDINYQDLKIIFPEQNPSSIELALSKFKSSILYLNTPMWQCLREALPDLKDPQEIERFKDFREKIVEVYEKLRNRHVN